MTKCDPEAQEILEYIAESPAAEYGGFDDRTIRAARWAVEKLAAARAEVERLQGELDECRRLLREAVQACEVYLPVVPDDKTRVALLTLEWYEAARAAGGEGVITAPKHTDTTHPCVHGCGTRYVVTRRTDGGLWLRYTPREVERCGECTRTDKAEKAAGGEES